MNNRTPDKHIFASVFPGFINDALIGDRAEMGDSCGFRIPSLITAPDETGKEWLVAVIDRGNDGADWGKVDIAVRRSDDLGDTWEPLKRILRAPVHTAPQGFEDWSSAFYIDPLTVRAADGSLLLIADFFPESKGLRDMYRLEESTGYVEIDGQSYLALYDGASPCEDESAKTNPGTVYTVRKKGWVYDEMGNKTGYYLPQDHSSEWGYETIGDLYFAVGEPDYIETAPPLFPQNPDDCPGVDIYVGNVYLNVGKPIGLPQNPVFVQKRKAGPEEKSFSRYETAETDPAPLRAAVTSYLVVSKSRDGGKTWSQPREINAQIKDAEHDGLFLETGPGTGVTLCRQNDPHKNGRILMPLYCVNDAVVIFSDDGGITWNRSSSPSGPNAANEGEVQCAELFDGVVMMFGRQTGPAATPVSYSFDGGETFSSGGTTALLSVQCQKSEIAYPMDVSKYQPGMNPDRQYIVSSHPSGNDRINGTISLGEVEDDYTIKWIAERPLGGREVYEQIGEPDYFSYSSLAVLENGEIGLFYEGVEQNCLQYTRFSLAWILGLE